MYIKCTLCVHLKKRYTEMYIIVYTLNNSYNTTILKI